LLHSFLIDNIKLKIYVPMRLIYDKGALEFPLNNKTETFDL